MAYRYRIAIDIEFGDDFDNLQERLDEIEDRLEDVSPALRWGGKVLERAFSRNFTTLGAESARSMAGSMWPPLDASYASWKATRFPGAPMMVQSGKLFSKVESMTKSNVSRVENMEATFGISSEYAKFHQYGTKNMPERKIIFVPRNFPERLGQKIADYVVNGRKARVEAD